MKTVWQPQSWQGGSNAISFEFGSGFIVYLPQVCSGVHICKIAKLQFRTYASPNARFAICLR
jgi:hypothetical protein